ncbi:N-acetyltransferase 10 [Tilletia horrida]|uniref:RNA cytidine acetyltransferase n=1 Tax=Tilletia horrida TaxID=155126 RepID=A0AAN6JT78_9BASI|nr:N-acetyltransferase 10 [Tilletia horrida]KAK0564675.1 N-acetyltransferase 10 [Tilletia horrida]
MPRRKLDERIPALIQRGVLRGHRSLFVLIGDRANDSIPLLHYLLAQSRVAARPNVLWCYKSDLGFTTHRKKRAAKIKREIARGIRDKDGDGAGQTPFELFVGVTDIRYTYYKESHSILGQTFGMLILQDFEALTPNLLARTIETVEGGGIVVLVLRTMSSLRQLYSLSMDAHAKFRSSFTGAQDEPVARFNERFLLSLGACHDCLLLDDELNVLPLSRAKDIQSLQDDPEGAAHEIVEKGKARITRDQIELQALKQEVGQTKIVGEVVKHAKTLDQARAVLNIIDILGASPASASGSLSSSLQAAQTISLTAARGRGKSATLGLALSAAIAHGYSNIYVTSPSPSNLGTLFDFFLKGLKELGYDEVADLEIFRGVPEGVGEGPIGAGEGAAKSRQVVLRVSVAARAGSSDGKAGGGALHRQVVQYLPPSSPAARDILSNQAELLVIDEAAAIPLPVLNDLLGSPSSSPSGRASGGVGTAAGNYMVWLSSTTDGYEGTGRGLSLKLLSKLRESGGSGLAGGSGSADSALLGSFSGKNRSQRSQAGGNALGITGGVRRLPRKLKELTLTTPIRYSANDPIEAWLYQLLCLPATDLSPSASTSGSKPIKSPPHPSECDLFLVNRDALFSFHPASEAFLQSMMNLYTASHYKNSPNDLQLMSDAPAQRLFVLLPRSGTSGSSSIPEPLAVLQVSLEGHVSRASVLNALARGTRGDAGDLIPWTLSQQFQDPEFASQLSGARVVRVAVRTECTRMGYGKRAISALREFYARAWEGGASATMSAGGAGSGASGSGSKSAFVSLSGAGGSKGAALQSESIAVRSGASLPPLLHRLSSLPTPPEKLDWLGVSYGMTPSLLRFWNRAGYVPLYVRQTPNEITGEYSAIQVRSVLDGPTSSSSSSPWLAAFAVDFQRRFLSLMGYRFREWDAVTALTVMENVNAITGSAPSTKYLTHPELRVHLTPFDMKRLEGYSHGNIDYGVIVDLLPLLSQLYYTRKLYDVSSNPRAPLKLSALQSALLLGLGSQRKDVADLSAELDVPPAQVLALLNKGVRSIVLCLRDVERAVIEAEMDGKASGSTTSGVSAKVLDTTRAGRAIVGSAAPRADEVERELEAVGKDSLEQDATQREKRQLEKKRLDSMDFEDEGGDHDDDERDDDEEEDDDDDGEEADESDKTASALEPSSRDWSEAERQVDALIRESKENGGRKLSSVVSVRMTGQEAEEAAAAQVAKKSGKNAGSDAKNGKRKAGHGTHATGKKARRS